MSLINKLDGILAKFNELENKLQDPNGLGQNFAKISKEHSDMQEVVAIIQQFKTAQKEFNDIEQMLTDSSLDKEMRDMMEEEKFNLSKKIPDLEHQIKIALIPKDSADEKNAIIEVRAGTGGEEAALLPINYFTCITAMLKKIAGNLRFCRFPILVLEAIKKRRPLFRGAEFSRV